LESLAHRSGVWLALALIGLFAGLQSVAALRGGLLLVTGPLNLLFVGAAFVAVPESVRLFEHDPYRLPRLTWLVSLGVTGLSALWCGAVLLSGGLVGDLVLGETWPLARPLLVLLALFAVAQALAIGPAQGLWALGAAGRSLASQLTNVVVLVATTSAGAVLDGARGAAVGLVVTGIISLAVWSWQFSRGFRKTLGSRRLPDSGSAHGDSALSVV
jgi:O-antigen/teichoic acid export membrane protein